MTTKHQSSIQHNQDLSEKVLEDPRGVRMAKKSSEKQSWKLVKGQDMLNLIGRKSNKAIRKTK